MPDLRYTACRMSELVSNVEREKKNEGIGARFGNVLLAR